MDPLSLDEVVSSVESDKWLETMKPELLGNNSFWDLVHLSMGLMSMECKRVYEIKKDSKENVKCYKEKLVAKWYTQREVIDYNETFSPIFLKSHSK